MQSCDFKMTSIRIFSRLTYRISHGAEWTMTGTPWSYAAFRGAGCARAIKCLGIQRADESPAYQHGANYRTYKPERHIAGHASKAGPPGAMHIQRIPRARGLARGSNDATTISETNPLMINKSICQPLDPRASRGQLVRWIFMSLLRVRARLPWRRWKRRRPRRNGRKGKKLIVIVLICLTHSRYWSIILCTVSPTRLTSQYRVVRSPFNPVFKIIHSLFSMKSLLCYRHKQREWERRICGIRSKQYKNNAAIAIVIICNT